MAKEPIEKVENEAAGEWLRWVMWVLAVVGILAKKVKNVKYRQYNICLYFMEL